MAELSKLLGFMSSWDRQAVLDKYNALFDEAGDEVAFIKMLGSPTHLAINLANSYVPTPAPEKKEEEKKDLSPFAEFEDPPVHQEESLTEEKSEAPTAVPSAPEMAECDQQAEAAAPAGGRRLRPVGLVASILFGLVIGVPVAIVLILTGIPVLALGGGIVGLDVFLVMELVGALTMVSDILVVVGAALLIAALGLLLFWFGLWLSISLGRLWIGGAVLGLGRRMSYKKEEAEI